MFKRGFLLETTEKLAAAQHNQQEVEVYKNGQYLHCGTVEDQVEEAIYINGGFFLKDRHVFKSENKNAAHEVATFGGAYPGTI